MIIALEHLIINLDSVKFVLKLPENKIFIEFKDSKTTELTVTSEEFNKIKARIQGK